MDTNTTPEENVEIETTDTSDVPDMDAPVEAFGAVNVPTEKAEHVEKIETTAQDGQGVDIFSWANQTDGVKNELRVEFFLFNKNFTPYTTTIADELDTQIKSLFCTTLLTT